MTGPRDEAGADTMTIECRFLDRGGSYERTVTGWVDTLEGVAAPAQRPAERRAGRPRGEPRRRAVAELPAVRGRPRRRAPSRRRSAAARCWRRSGASARLRIAAGFRRQVAGLLGEHPARRPPARRRHRGGPPVAAGDAGRRARLAARRSPAEFHRLDLEAWPELLDLCFTYRAETRALFAERAGPDAGDRRHVRVAARPEARVPPLQAEPRRPRAEGRSPSTSRCSTRCTGSSSGTTWTRRVTRSSRARALTPRLPYMGICEEPQQRVAGHDRREARRRLGGRRAGAARRAGEAAFS